MLLCRGARVYGLLLLLLLGGKEEGRGWGAGDRVDAYMLVTKGVEQRDPMFVLVRAFFNLKWRLLT